MIVEILEQREKMIAQKPEVRSSLSRPAKTVTCIATSSFCMLLILLKYNVLHGVQYISDELLRTSVLFLN